MRQLYSSKKTIPSSSRLSRRERTLLITLMAISIILTLQIGGLAFKIAISASHRGRMFATAMWLLAPLVVWIGSVAFFRHFLHQRKSFPAFGAAIFPLVFFLAALLFFNV